MSDDGSSDEESSDLDEIMDFDDLDFFDQELMDKYCSESASLKKEELAQSLKGAKDLFIQDGGPLKEGYFHKKQNLKKTTQYHRRFFTFRFNYLVYYEKESQAAIGALPIGGFNILRTIRPVSFKDSKPQCKKFKAHFTGNIVLSAETPSHKVAEEWIAILKARRAYYQKVLGEKRHQLRKAEEVAAAHNKPQFLPAPKPQRKTNSLDEQLGLIGPGGSAAAASPERANASRADPDEFLKRAKPTPAHPSMGSKPTPEKLAFQPPKPVPGRLRQPRNSAPTPRANSIVNLQSSPEAEDSRTFGRAASAHSLLMARLSAAEEENAVKTAAEIDLDHVVDIAGVKVRHSPLRRIKPEEQQFVRATAMGYLHSAEAHKLTFSDTDDATTTDAPRSSGQAGGGNVLVADVSEKSKPKPIIAAVVSDNEVLTRAHRSTAARRGAMYRIPTPNGSVGLLSRQLVGHTGLQIPTASKAELAVYKQELQADKFRFPERKGWLYRRTGSFFDEWQKWYCTLLNGVMYFFNPEEKSKTPNPVNALGLNSCPTVRIISRPSWARNMSSEDLRKSLCHADTPGGEGERTKWDVLHPPLFRRWLMQEQNNATMFEVHQSLAPEIHLIFRTDDPRESEGWVRDIRESISRWAALGRSFDGSKSGWLTQFVGKQKDLESIRKARGQGPWKQKFAVLSTNGLLTLYDVPPFFTPAGASELNDREIEQMVMSSAARRMMYSTRPPKATALLDEDAYVKSEANIPKRPHCFDLEVGEQFLLFEAASAEERRRWVASVQAVTAHVRQSKNAIYALHEVPDDKIPWLRKLNAKQPDEQQIYINSQIGKIVGIVRGKSKDHVEDVVDRCAYASKVMVSRAEEAARRGRFDMVHIIMKILVRRIQYTLDELVFDFTQASSPQRRKHRKQGKPGAAADNDANAVEGPDVPPVKEILSVDDMVRVADFVAGFNDVVSDLATVEQYAHDMARPQTLSQKSSIEAVTSTGLYFPPVPPLLQLVDRIAGVKPGSHAPVPHAATADKKISSSSLQEGRKTSMVDVLLAKRSMHKIRRAVGGLTSHASVAHMRRATLVRQDEASAIALAAELEDDETYLEMADGDVWFGGEESSSDSEEEHQAERELEAAEKEAAMLDSRESFPVPPADQSLSSAGSPRRFSLHPPSNLSLWGWDRLLYSNALSTAFGRKVRLDVNVWATEAILGSRIGSTSASATKVSESDRSLRTQRPGALFSKIEAFVEIAAQINDLLFQDAVIVACAQAMVDFQNINIAGLSLLAADSEVVHRYPIPKRSPTEVADLQTKYATANMDAAALADLANSSSKSRKLNTKQFLDKVNQQTKAWSNNLFKNLIGKKNRRVDEAEAVEAAPPPVSSDSDSDSDEVVSRLREDSESDFFHESAPLHALGLPPQWKSRQVQLKGQAALDSIVSAVNDSNHCVKLMEGLLQRHEFMLANRQGLAAMECASEKFGDGLNHGVNNLIDVLQGAHLGGIMDSVLSPQHVAGKTRVIETAITILNSIARYVSAKSGLAIKSMVVAHCFQYICHRYVQRMLELHPPPHSIIIQKPQSTTTQRAKTAGRMKRQNNHPSSSEADATSGDEAANANYSVDYGTQMSLKRITPLNTSILVSDVKLLVQCGLEYGCSEPKHGELNWLECLVKIGAILKEPATGDFNMDFMLNRTVAGNPYCSAEAALLVYTMVGSREDVPAQVRNSLLDQCLQFVRVADYAEPDDVDERGQRFPVRHYDDKDVVLHDGKPMLKYLLPNAIEHPLLMRSAKVSAFVRQRNDRRERLRGHSRSPSASSSGESSRAQTPVRNGSFVRTVDFEDGASYASSSRQSSGLMISDFGSGGGSARKGHRPRHSNNSWGSFGSAFGADLGGASEASTPSRFSLKKAPSFTMRSMSASSEVMQMAARQAQNDKKLQDALKMGEAARTKVTALEKQVADMSHRIANLMTQLNDAMAANNQAKTEAAEAQEEARLVNQELVLLHQKHETEKAKMKLTINNLTEDLHRIKAQSGLRHMRSTTSAAQSALMDLAIQQNRDVDTETEEW